MTTKTKATHTAGPWTLVPAHTMGNSSPLVTAQVDWTRFVIATMDREDEAEANARLIAAAPALLAALKALLASTDSGAWKVVDAARAALALATESE